MKETVFDQKKEVRTVWSMAAGSRERLTPDNPNQLNGGGGGGGEDGGGGGAMRWRSSPAVSSPIKSLGL